MRICRDVFPSLDGTFVEREPLASLECPLPMKPAGGSHSTNIGTRAHIAVVPHSEHDGNA